ncbi:MAG: ferredoxin [Acidobacteriota bacterium]
MGQYTRHIFVCTQGEYCPMDGSIEVHRILKEGVASGGLKGTVRVNRAGCFSQCGHGPMVVVYPEDVWYGSVSAEGARRILKEHIIGGRAVQELRYAAPAGDNKNGARMAEINARRGRRKPGRPSTEE